MPSVACHALGPRATAVGGLGHGDQQKPRSRLLTERGHCHQQSPWDSDFRGETAAGLCDQDCCDPGGEATLPPPWSP